MTKLIKWLLWLNHFEQRKVLPFLIATPSGFLGGGGGEVWKIIVQGSVQGKIVWNHFWEHRFSVPDPRVFPPPGDRYSTQTTKNRIDNWACPEKGSPVKMMSDSTKMDSEKDTIFKNRLILASFKSNLQNVHNGLKEVSYFSFSN